MCCIHILRGTPRSRDWAKYVRFPPPGFHISLRIVFANSAPCHHQRILRVRASYQRRPPGNNIRIQPGYNLRPSGPLVHPYNTPRRTHKCDRHRNHICYPRPAHNFDSSNNSLPLRLFAHCNRYSFPHQRPPGANIHTDWCYQFPSCHVPRSTGRWGTGYRPRNRGHSTNVNMW